MAILDKVKTEEQREWYIRKTAENGWSHSVLVHQIESNLYDIEQALVKDVTKLLLELGTGFAFLGNQYHLNVGGDDFYIDLLFYNLNLRCYVVIELKTGEFKPEYAGQLNFYLSAVDGILKKENDHHSIGLLLCKSKNDLVAEYALKDMSKPMGVSAYKVTSSLPEELQRQLPSIEDIEKRIQKG